MSAAFRYERTGRSLKTALIVGAVWLGLILLWQRFDAAPWILAFLALFTLPACWDLVTDPPSALTLTDKDLTFSYGKRSVEVALEDVAHVRMDTRLDMSVRITLILRTGAKVRLPYEVTPPHQAFEDDLHARGVATKRFHFQFWQ